MKAAVALGLGAALALAACDSGTEERPGVGGARTVMRDSSPPPGTMPRGASADAAALDPPGPPVTPELIRHGEERFLAFCSPCHGRRGHGDGVVVSRGFPRPPSYYQERLRRAAPEHVVAVITHGLGNMYPYAERVLPEDRWAIARYIKTLQANPPPLPADTAAP